MLRAHVPLRTGQYGPRSPAVESPAQTGRLLLLAMAAGSLIASVRRTVRRRLSGSLARICCACGTWLVSAKVRLRIRTLSDSPRWATIN